MPKVTPAHREARRAQIVEAAIRCFSRQGFHRATMHDVVRESRLSPGAIYRYFGSKDDLVEAIAADRHARERRWIAEARAQDTLRRGLQRLAQSFFGSLRSAQERKRRALTIQLWAEALRRPAILKRVRQGVDEPRAALRALIEEAQHRGEVPAGLSSEALARVMIAVFQGFVLQQAWDPRAEVTSYLQVVETLFGALEDGSAGRRRAPRRRRP